jgi:hypothetical protein
MMWKRSIRNTHHVALEIQLSLEDPVDQLIVLACPGPVDFVVRAHERGDTSLDRVGERPKVQLVERSVVDVGAHGLTVALLFVADVMLCTSLHASVLHTLDGVGHRNACEVRVRGETLPVATSLRDLAESACYLLVCVQSIRTGFSTSHWRELNIDTNTLRLGAHCIAASIDERSIPGRRNVNAGREDSYALDVSDASSVSTFLGVRHGCLSYLNGPS